MSRNTTLERKAVYVGIDYHKQFSVLTFGDRQGNVLEQLKLVNETSLVEKFFARFGPLECAIESCRGYEWLLELLLEQGHRVHMGDSRSIKLIAVTRCKTDKIDSKILMELLAKGFLPEAYAPSAKERDYRELLRHRVQLVRTQVRHKLRVHSLLDKENKGIRYPFSVKGRKELDVVQLNERRQQMLLDELRVIDFTEELVLEQDAKIKRLCRSNPDVYRLRTIPGFDWHMSLTFIAELGDPNRFRNADQVAAFIGVVPSVYSSGGTKRTGRITKQGPNLLRWMLVQAAWAAIKSSPNLRRQFSTIAKRRGQKVAIVAVARKLATIAFHVLKDKAKFEEEKLDAGLARAAF
jgi:transposase